MTGDIVEEYSNYISLGYFCSVAMELERIGLRSASYPFDWLVTPEMKNVMRMIETGFDGFLDRNVLACKTDDESIIVNSELNFYFVHDFSGKKSIDAQLTGVKEKYDRRIDRFYRSITKPTLFIRYISDEEEYENGKSADLRWIEDNLDHIHRILKEYNDKNDIIWIANDTLTSERIKLFSAQKDPEDTVSRKPLDKNRELFTLLNDCPYEGRAENISRYNEKLRKRNSLFNRIKTKFYHKATM